MRRIFVVLGLGLVAVIATSGAASASERIGDYQVHITVLRDGSLQVRERIDYDFGSEPHHGIFRDIPTTLAYDDRFDRTFPLHVDGVQIGDQVGAGWSMRDVPWTIEHPGGGITRIKVGDPDATVSGRHLYDVRYTVEGALNAFPDHDELYWNAIGTEWALFIDRASVVVDAPAPISHIACFQGPEGSHLPCDRARSAGSTATFAQTDLFPFEGLTIVVALPSGTIQPPPAPILHERLTLMVAFRVTPARGAVAAVLAVLGLACVAWLVWMRGRDRRYRGSAVDQAMGGSAGEEPVPIGDADSSAPVEFAPPEDIRPGQVGVLVEERATTLDVSATIVDLAVRGFLMIQEIPQEGRFGKPDWRLIRLEKPDADLLAYERALLSGLFRDSTDVELSSLRTTFVERLQHVEEGLYADVMAKGWFRNRPDRVRTRWHLIGFAALIVAVGITWMLAFIWRLGIIGVPLIVAAIALWIGAGRMPARTAKGTAILRRVRGFRTVIDKAEANMARWAEQENVFTKYLPFAIVFGLTEKWAEAFASLGDAAPDTAAWYVSGRPFIYADFAHAIDGFTVSTSGTIASTPAGSGSSGFSGGGGSSGGGGGGGGGGSW